MIIAGGAEAAVSPLSFAGFCSMKAMSTRNDDPKAASRPFDADRDGFVLSEGAKGKVITRKPILPSEEELEVNPRSKSAKLRVFERVKQEQK